MPANNATMSIPDLSTITPDSIIPSPAQAAVGKTALCPKCGRRVESLRCGHCGSRLPDWQAALYAATIRKLGKTGGNRADAASKGGNGTGNGKHGDSGGASTPQWLFDRCNQLAIAACGEPITLDVAAAGWNHKCERYFTKEDDASLRKTWHRTGSAEQADQFP